MPSIMNKNIEQIFNTLDSHESSYGYSFKQFNKSNLWIVKDNNGNCGLLIENAHDSDKLGEYKNLYKKTFNEFQSKKNKLSSSPLCTGIPSENQSGEKITPHIPSQGMTRIPHSGTIPEQSSWGESQEFIPAT